MKKIIQTGSILTALLLTGCVSSLPTMTGSNLNQENQRMMTFKTNQVHFMHSLKKTSSMNERNTYLDEFILKSDVQCQNYLNSPLKKPEVEQNKNSLYLSLFDGVAGLFGVSILTNTAKAVFLNDNDESIEEKKAYANALSPEIRKGVELGRSRYARTMIQKKNLKLQAYSINDLQEDILKYDKQCNDAYGLIEISRALKEMQSTMHTQTVPKTPILQINPQAIKAKVEAVTKEVKEKKIKKEKEKAKEKEKVKVLPIKSLATQAAPKQPKLENAPVHHDNVQDSPRSK